jgi:VCBS repeat-containing protein
VTDLSNQTSTETFDLLTPLEPRLVFDGAAANDALDGLVVDAIDLSDMGHVDAGVDFTDGLALVAERDIAADRREVIFVDASIANLTNILGQLPDTAEIQLVDSSTDGIAAIANWASTQTNIDAIHIISHGAQGELYLGSSVLSNDTIAAVSAELTTLGGALTETGDILLYGCNIADGAAGLDFIERFAQATSADIAASSDDTGTAVLGGDWDLEVQAGDVDSDVVVAGQYDAILSAGQYVEDGNAILVASGYTFTDTGDYTGGTIKYTVSSAASSETLSFLKVASASFTDGEISIVGNNVYMGVGGNSAKVIGSVDATNNGTSGKPLQINLTVGFTNPGFDDTATKSLTSTTNVIEGWTVKNENISISDGDKIDGLAIPTDQSWPWRSYPSQQDNDRFSGSNFSSAVESEAGRGSVIRMTSTMTSASGYAVIRGPYIYSNATAALSVGDQVKFDWKAAGGADSFDVFGYIINRNNPSDYQVILNSTGADRFASTSWRTETITVNSAGDYQFVFLSGTWDATGGQALGAQLYIDNVQVTQQSTTTLSGADVAQITSKLTYRNASQSIPVSVTSRSITADYTRGNGTSPTPQTLTFSELGKNDAPVLGGTTFNLTTITEDDSTNAGQLVSAIVGTAITDVDASPVEGIAITGLTESAGNGVWQYQLSGSSTWVTVGAVDATSALLLGANDKIRFMPDEAFGGTASFTFNAWDQTSGTAGTKVAIGTTGGTTAFSTASKTANITVTSIDDAPVLTASATGTEMLTGTARAIAPGLTITDVDSTTLSGAKVSVSNLKSGDVLAVSGTLPTGITASYSASTGVLTLSGSASLADYQAALRAVTFDTTSTDTTDRTFDFSLGEALAFSGNGHYYEFVSASGIEWADAKAAAEARTFLGMQGYLVTVTSAEENAFVASKLAGQGWMGASDATTEDAWYWVTGPETGTKFWQGTSATSGGVVVDGQYNNWASGEPNDSGSNEDYAHFYSNGTWNDFKYDNASIDGYVVEYGTSTSGSGVASLKSVVSSVTRADLTKTAIEDGSTRSGQNAVGNALFDNVDSGSALIFKLAGVKKAGDTTFATISASSTSASGATEIAGLYGTLTIGEDGSYSYAPNNDNSTVAGLNVNDTITDSFVLNVVDAADGAVAERTLVMTIDGTNDAPVADDSSASVTEDAASISGDVTSIDVDNSEIDRTYSLTNAVDGLTMGTDGSWSFDPSNAAYQYLAAGQTLEINAGFVVTDGENAEDTGTLTITVTGVNDAPLFGTVSGTGGGVSNDDITVSGGVAPDASVEFLNNGALRFGGGGHQAEAPESVVDSVNMESGTLEQPFYYEDGQWYKLTYSSYKLDIALRVGDQTVDSQRSGQMFTQPTVDVSGYDPNTGTGTIIYTGYITINDVDLKVTQKYQLQPNQSFVKGITQITNVDTVAAANVKVWNGTRDDWVGNSDGPTKVRGNIIDGQFVAITDPADQAKAIQVTSQDASILFYSNSDGANTSIADCCSFSNAYNIDPTVSDITRTGDGSYAILLDIGTLAAGETRTVDYYYAAGSPEAIADVVRQVADASAAGLPETNERLTATGVIPVTDVDVRDVVKATTTGYSAVFHDRNGDVALSQKLPDLNTAMGAMISMTPLNPDAVVALGATTGDLAWTFDSGNETFDFLASGESIVVTYNVRVTDLEGATADTTVEITINGTNDAPVVEEVIPETVSVTGAQISYPTAYAFSDIDASDVLVYSASGLPPGMTIDPVTGIISGSSIVPDDYTVIITATDPFGGTVNAAPFILKVVSPPAPPAPLPPANDGPPAGPADIFTPEVTTDTVLKKTAPGKGLSKPAGEPNGGGMPAGGVGHGLISAATISTGSIAIARPLPDMGVTSGPVGFIVPRDTFITTASSLSLSASLADGSALPDWLEFDAETGEFSGTPPEGYEGELDLMVKARDSNGGEASTSFTLTVGDLAEQDAKLEILDWDSIETDFASVETGKAVKGAAPLSQVLKATRIGVGAVSFDTVIAAE